MPDDESRSGSRDPHPLFKLFTGADFEAHVEPPNRASKYPDAAALPELVSFVGFVSGSIKHPGSNTRWLLMYDDPQLQSWLLVEGTGIVSTGKMADEAAPAGPRDVIWVRRDAAVGKGSGPQSDEARFLTGEFTRAGDFYAAPAGGTMAASTGVFCGGNTAFCCRRPSQSGGG